MNIFGIGGMELILILVIMLVVLGPRGMIRWAYKLGQYTAKFRRMWEETVDVLQKEFDEAGVDVQVPRELPTRSNINRAVNQAVQKVAAPVTQPVQEAVDEVDRVKRMVTRGENGRATEPSDAPPANPAPNLGAWSGKPADADGGSDA